MEDTSLEDFLDDDDESSEAESERSDTDLDAGDESSGAESEHSETESDVGDESSGAESEHSKTASDAGDESSEAESKSPDAESPAGVEAADDLPDVEPADVTARWTADGACCDGCGNEVERLWTDGETAVCSECKNWE